MAFWTGPDARSSHRHVRLRDLRVPEPDRLTGGHCSYTTHLNVRPHQGTEPVDLATSLGPRALRLAARGGGKRFDRASEFAAFEHALSGDRGEQVHRARDDPGPPGLVAGAEAGAVVAVEILVEQ